MLNLIIALICGVLFGLGMAISGMVDPKNVIDFLDIFGSWNADLMFVLGGAILVFMPCFFLFIRHKEKSVTGNKFSFSTKKHIDAKLICGATLFGIGWGLAGICPGPALSSLTGDTFNVLIFIISMIIGQWLIRKWVK